MKKVFLYLLIAALTIPMSYAQQSRFKKNHAFSGTLMLGLEGGMSLAFTDYSDTRPDVLGRGLLEYFFPTTDQGIFGIRAFVLTGYISADDTRKNPNLFKTNITSIGGGFSYNLSIQDAVFPYAFAGASYTMFDPKDQNRNPLPGNLVGNYNKNEHNYHAEVGVKFLLSNTISLNLSVAGQFSPKDNWDEQIYGANDMFIATMAGISYSFFTDVDSDGDGVQDEHDQCPDTPQGVKVDNFGCPLDTDGDGIPDYKDKCPNTKKGLQVNEEGCAVDADNDGVPDARDKCPNTPEGAKVNEDGCPDSDNDGVADNEDKCPDTPAGAKVDDRGCPVDSDNDGVPDYKDDCPNTPAGQQVDTRGCSTKPDTVRVEKRITLSGDTNFEFNKSTLLQSAYPMLNKVAASMKDNPETRWMIEGHTDAVGSDSYNMQLSRERAQAVADYLVSQGVESSRLEIVPKGETAPVASNDTNEGRAMNRRVELRLIEK